MCYKSHFSYLTMERLIQKDLIAWAENPNRLPLILQGARQVGKTYLMNWLGKNHFEKSVYFNFDERPELGEFFKMNKDVNRIIESLSLIGDEKIDNNTLVIFDEIQECPEALNSLKYFAEKKPELAIICAGSLLGILLHSGYSFPVGKVSFLQIYPMTFREVLPYWNATAAAYLNQGLKIEAIPDYFFNDLLDAYKRYLVTGGLPAVVNEYDRSKSFNKIDDTLQNLILSYIGDFSKHPVTSDIAKISQVFESIPSQLAKENKKFIYSLVRSGARSREYEDAIEWLVKTGLIHRIRLISKPNLPLSAYEDPHAFKVYSFDVGVLRKMSQLSPIAYTEGDRLLTEFKGSLSENLVLQSLLTQYNSPFYYWTSGNTAEVDFILQHDNLIIPVEVKSDKNIRSRSLTLYAQKYNPEIRIRYSLKNLQWNDGMLNIPIFLADYTKELVESILG